jgi:hypothetical protein
VEAGKGLGLGPWSWVGRGGKDGGQGDNAMHARNEHHGFFRHIHVLRHPGQPGGLMQQPYH